MARYSGYKNCENRLSDKVTSTNLPQIGSWVELEHELKPKFELFKSLNLDFNSIDLNSNLAIK